ncbi:hypothetical protein ASF41_22360 [Methylobacterium sp. Leaf111]|uniref:hypothetical protein n=1 Tax=Methylobacterium sp. Leaf111 TaxID=1736257 RepID=UPI000701F61D|nr:hypothetical protein [Methylobacterium sp. Leaf111]KQP63284.1 hypothetical protein ASF41_22360 [Methylobacterium sp. Leaf111]
MTERDAGYLQALADVQGEVRKTVQDPSTSREGRLELLGVLSFLSDLVDVKVRAYHDEAAASTFAEDRWEREP